MTRKQEAWKYEKEILDDINDYRKKNNKLALKWCENCAHYAEGHSLDMAYKKVPFSHDGINDRLAKIKQLTPKYQVGSENVGFSHPGEFDVVEAWSKSAGHKKNMLGEFTHCGVGHAFDPTGKNHYYTAIFIRVGK